MTPAEKFRQLLSSGQQVKALGCVTGIQAVQTVKAGLPAVYVSGWQVAADANEAGETYPDLGLYPSNSVPKMVKRIGNALRRAEQIDRVEYGDKDISGRAPTTPIIADGEAGWGSPLTAFEFTRQCIEAGAAAVHFEDQLSGARRCGHLGGKVLVPVNHHIRTLKAARLAADLAGEKTVVIARTDAMTAKYIVPYKGAANSEERFIDFCCEHEDFYGYIGGLDAAIERSLAFAPHADMLWCETPTPDLNDAKEFADAIHAKFPGKWLCYNLSPSFNWTTLDQRFCCEFQDKLHEIGYGFTFITLAGFHSLALGMFELAGGFIKNGMGEYADLQRGELYAWEHSYTAVKHQQEVGVGYWDAVLEAIAGKGTGGAAAGSTEKEQF